MTEPVVQPAAAAANGGDEEEEDRVLRLHESIVVALTCGVPDFFRRHPRDIEVVSDNKGNRAEVNLVNLVKQSTILSWIEERKGGNGRVLPSDEIASLCAVDGLRRDPSTGEYTTDWIHYADNLEIKLLRPGHLLDLIDSGEDDPLVAHVHAVRRMYRHLRRPEEVRSALTRFYGSLTSRDEDERRRLPRCTRRYMKRVIPALESYYVVMGAGGRHGQKRLSVVANRLGLPLEAQPRCDDGENCIACGAGFGIIPPWRELIWNDDEEGGSGEGVRRLAIQGLFQRWRQQADHQRLGSNSLFA